MEEDISVGLARGNAEGRERPTSPNRLRRTGRNSELLLTIQYRVIPRGYQQYQ